VNDSENERKLEPELARKLAQLPWRAGLPLPSPLLLLSGGPSCWNSCLSLKVGELLLEALCDKVEKLTYDEGDERSVDGVVGTEGDGLVASLAIVVRDKQSGAGEDYVHALA
jgi:hypothetical protein